MNMGARKPGTDAWTKAIACADSPTFEKNNAVDNNTVVTIYRDSEHQSKITLPIIPE